MPSGRRRLGAAVLMQLALTVAPASEQRGIDFVAQSVPPTPGVPSQWLLEPAIPLSPILGGVFTWPIVVLNDERCRRVTDVSVDVVGLRVPRSKGVSARLLHSGAAAQLFTSTGTATRIGSLPILQSAASKSLVYPARQSPYKLRFTDIQPLSSPNVNLLLGQPATASSTMMPGSTGPGKAVDGVRDGYLSNGGVFISGPSSVDLAMPEAWLEVDLGVGAAPVGSVHVYDRGATDGDGRQPQQSAVQEVRVSTLEAVPAGTFQLSMTLGGVTYTTDPIALDAQASGPANTMQSAVEAFTIIGNVMVSRRTTPGTKPSYGAYAWRITFIGNAGLPQLQVVPGSVVRDGGLPWNVGNTVSVSTSILRHGRGNLVYGDAGRPISLYQPCVGASLQAAFATPEERCADLACGSGVAPGWLILSSAPLGNLDTAAALGHASVLYKTRLPCPAEGKRQILLNLRVPIAARYLRIQRAAEDRRPLHLAEVEAYASQHKGLGQWLGEPSSTSTSP